MTFSIVRPTAFFKSVSGQYESILKGNSYILFGDGAVTQCNPIAAEDLAVYLCDSALEEYKEQRWGKVSNVGGPDTPLTNKMLGEVRIFLNQLQHPHIRRLSTDVLMGFLKSIFLHQTISLFYIHGLYY